MFPLVLLLTLNTATVRRWVPVAMQALKFLEVALRFLSALTAKRLGAPLQPGALRRTKGGFIAKVAAPQCPSCAA